MSSANCKLTSFLVRRDRVVTASSNDNTHCVAPQSPVIGLSSLLEHRLAAMQSTRRYQSTFICRQMVLSRVPCGSDGTNCSIIAFSKGCSTENLPCFRDGFSDSDAVRCVWTIITPDCSRKLDQAETRSWTSEWRTLGLSVI